MGINSSQVEAPMSDSDSDMADLADTAPGSTRDQGLRGFEDDDLAASQLHLEEASTAATAPMSNGVAPGGGATRSRTSKKKGKKKGKKENSPRKPRVGATGGGDADPSDRKRHHESEKDPQPDMYAPNPVGHLFRGFPPSPEPTQPPSGQTGGGVLVPKTHFSAASVDVSAPLSPRISGGLSPSSSPEMARTRNMTRQSLTVGLSSQTDAGTTNAVPKLKRSRKTNGAIIEPVNGSADPGAGTQVGEGDTAMADVQEGLSRPKKRKRTHKLGEGDLSVIADSPNGPSGESVGPENGDFVESSALQKRRKLKRDRESVNQGEVVGGSHAFGASNRIADNGAVEAEKGPVFPADLLKKVRAKENLKLHANDTDDVATTGAISTSPEKRSRRGRENAAATITDPSVNDTHGRFVRELYGFLSPQEEMEHELEEPEEPIQAETSREFGLAVQAEVSPRKSKSMAEKKQSNAAQPAATVDPRNILQFDQSTGQYIRPETEEPFEPEVAANARSLVQTETAPLAIEKTTNNVAQSGKASMTEKTSQRDLAQIGGIAPGNKNRSRKKRSKATENAKVIEPDNNAKTEAMESGSTVETQEADEPQTPARYQESEEASPSVEKEKRRKKKRESEAVVAEAEAPTEMAISPARKTRKKDSIKTPKGRKNTKKAKPDRGTQTTKRRAAAGAETELGNVRQLTSPADLRESGEFTEDEAELIRRCIQQYQFRNDLSIPELVDLIQWTKPYGASKTKENDSNGTTQPEAQQWTCSTEFWREIYDVLPKRKNAKTQGGTTSIKRFVRRKYHKFKGGGNWDEAEETLLGELAHRYPNQWKKISALMGDRAEDACRDRWRNYVQYSHTRNTRRWSDEEEAALARAVREVIENLKAAREELNRPPLEEYTSRDINWQLVSEKVGSRSRLQCAKKWKQIQRNLGVPDWTPTRASGRSKSKSPKRKSRQSTAANKEDENGQINNDDEHAPDSVSPKPKRKLKPGFNKMRWGDKLDVIVALSDLECDTEEEIDWREVAAKFPGTPWSTKAFKAVLKELVEIVGKRDDLPRAFAAYCDYLQENHSAEVGEHYNPGRDGESEEEEEEEGQKRKRPAKGRGGQSQAAKEMKSSEFITASDDEL